MRYAFAIGLTLLLAGSLAFAGNGPAVVIGAVYPTAGGQGRGGTEEFRGVSLAAEYVNAQGGVSGRRILVRLEPADSWDAAPGAVEHLARDGIMIVVGSHGSTISRPAAETASRLGQLFWETGAVGTFSMDTASGTRVFRFAPTGASLGRAAVTFIRDQLTPRLKPHRSPRYAVVYVDDVYGQAVAAGAVAEIQRSGLMLAATLPYQLSHVDYDALAGRIRQAHADVLVVAQYLDDAVALRRALLRAHVPLMAGIGTSSSYCMPEFGEILGQQAVGLFASDKPDGGILKPNRLSPEAAQALRWATAVYQRRYGEPMSAHALAGFAGGLALFRYVLPHAGNLSPAEIARAALRTHLPVGSLPNGSGLAFAPPGRPNAGVNLLATSVIWEWVRPRTRAVVWPPAFATHGIVF